MRYLLIVLSALILQGCTEDRPESILWKITNDCERLADLIGAEKIKLFDKEEHGKINAVCELTKKKEFVYWLRNEEVEGAVRGIEMYHNKNLVDVLNKCIEKNKCQDLKDRKAMECHIDCQLEVGWMR